MPNGVLVQILKKQDCPGKKSQKVKAQLVNPQLAGALTWVFQ